MSASPVRPAHLGSSPLVVHFGERGLRFVRSHIALALSLVVVILLCTSALFGPMFANDPYQFSASNVLADPSSSSWFGTDDKGRDVFARTVEGLAISLTVGVGSAALGVTFGLIVALITSFRGGWVDSVTQRVVEVLLAFPVLLFAMVVSAAVGPSTRNITLVLAFAAWPSSARVFRSAVLSQANSTYVLSARAIGASEMRIRLIHIIPNLVSVYLVVVTVWIAQAILAEASLSFLGLGVNPPQASLGAMVADGQQYFQRWPHLALFPGVLIAIAVFSFNVLGDSLRDYFDPRLRHR